MGAKSQSKKRVARTKTIRCSGLLVSLVQDKWGTALTFQTRFVLEKRLRSAATKVASIFGEIISSGEKPFHQASQNVSKSNAIVIA
jgi:hypothetical protein